MNTVEKVARAISASRAWGDRQFDMESESWQQAHLDMAKAAILAMPIPQATIDKMLEDSCITCVYAEGNHTMTIDMVIAKLWGRNGVADSQLYMGHWTPEFYDKKIRQYRSEFLADILKLYEPTDHVISSKDRLPDTPKSDSSS